MRSASSAFCASAFTSCAGTFAVKVRVCVAEPRVTVAVSVAVATPLAGRVTTPLVEITAVSLEDQAMAEPFAPVVGRVRFAVTDERSPRSRAAVSRATLVVSVACRPATSEAVSALL